MDPKGVLKNASCYTVAEHWDGGGYYGLDFDITDPVYAGETYYLEVRSRPFSIRLYFWEKRLR